MTKIRYEVVLTNGAERDLEDLYDYVAHFDSATKAQQLLDNIITVARGLSTSPERGAFPKELLALGIREYRQVLFKPYRVIYRIVEQQVVVFAILDGRRSVQTLLERRLLGGGGSP